VSFFLFFFFPSCRHRSVQTRTDWACDYEADMAATFKANNQHCHVRGAAGLPPAGARAAGWQLRAWMAYGCFWGRPRSWTGLFARDALLREPGVGLPAPTPAIPAGAAAAWRRA
jgi:hypothetical protein